MYKILYLFILIFFSGCSISNNNLKVPEKEKYTTVREYKDISKDAIFEAAKKVFIISGGSEFRIDSYRDNLQVSKTKLTHYPFYAYTTDDIWNISIDEKENVSTVKVSLKRVKDFDKQNASYLSKDLHELLLDRVDFLLGLKDSWPWCIGYFTFDDALCDVIDLHLYTRPTKEDKVKDILISQRKPSQSIPDIDKDILNDDIVLSLEDGDTDILNGNVADKKEEKSKEPTAEDDALDKRILELNDKVNSNVKEMLDKNEEKIKDE
ncbi:MAG: hypothetical protein ACNI25_05370 [Halarcobacter sp.]